MHHYLCNSLVFSTNISENCSPQPVWRWGPHLRTSWSPCRWFAQASSAHYHRFLPGKYWFIFFYCFRELFRLNNHLICSSIYRSSSLDLNPFYSYGILVRFAQSTAPYGSYFLRQEWEWVAGGEGQRVGKGEVKVRKRDLTVCVWRKGGTREEGQPINMRIRGWCVCQNSKKVNKPS